MHKPVKYVEKAVTIGAKGVWAVFDRVNRIKPNPSPTPKWSDKPLLKSYQKSKPPLGWPRATDSLCPKCVPEIRQQILDGHLPHEVLLNDGGFNLANFFVDQNFVWQVSVENLLTDFGHALGAQGVSRARPTERRL